MMDPDPFYEMKSIVRTGANCPIFVKFVPISSAPIIGARWMANLSATLRGMLQIFYAFIASLLWTGNTSGKLIQIFKD